ncbi:MAG: T9SS type A sorting domain-containing protein [Bacteroidales bacterium]|nr:T9SS type A sorting domain-containing protein [Bacteroidales bacterium]
MYEDTINQEVYFRDPEGNEGLIYDYSVSVGDTVNIVNCYYNYERVLVCNAIDSLIIHEQFKKRFRFSVNYAARYGEDVWIEDIGSMNGILYPGVTLDGGFREFLCYKYNDTLIYTNPIHQTCQKDAFYPYIVQEYYDTAYLYYPYEFRFQITDTTEIDNVSWYGWEIPQDFYLDQVNGILEGYPTQLGSFFCAITVTNWSFHTDKLLGYITVVNPTAINSISVDDKIELSPNPCKEKLFIDIHLPIDIKLNITIYDVRGQVVIEQTRQPDSKNAIDCHSFPSGVYFVKIEDPHGRFVARKKFVKM